MSSLRPKDRASLCSFSFVDGRRCLTPRAAKNPRYCFYHAQKQARARNAQKLGKDLDYFFSGNYLSACDLTTALGHLIPAVVRGDVKPRTARTVAYLAQTLMQAIHVSEHEYTNTFGTDGWRQSIRNSVKGNYDYRFPPAPAPEPPPDQAPEPLEAAQPVEPSVNCHSAAVAQAFRPAESASSSNSPLATQHSPLPQSPPHTPLPATGAEFADQILARLPRPLPSDLAGLTGGSQAPQLASAPSANIPQPFPVAPFRGESSPVPASSSSSASALQPPAAMPVNSERSEDSALSSDSPPVTGLPAVAGHSPTQATSASAKTQPTPATPSAQSVAPVPQPGNPPPARPSTSPREPNRDAPWLYWGDQSHIPPDSHLL